MTNKELLEKLQEDIKRQEDIIKIPPFFIILLPLHPRNSRLLSLQ